VSDALLEAALRGTTRETLLRAGARAVERRAGWKPSLAKEPDRAPEETLPPCSPRAAETISLLFELGDEALLREAAQLLRQAKQRLRPELLPEALSLHSEEFLDLLGARGPWLAKMREDWAWASAAGEQLDAGAIWNEGTHPERVALLKRLRDPEQKLALIASTWKSEKADHRAEFLALAAPSDEAFLEAALDDRSQTVRQRAAQLLARLPGSKLQQRMQERLTSLVSKKEVRLPEELDAAWERDGVLRNPPQGMGAKAFWLLQTVALVNPAFWEDRRQLVKDEVLAGVQRATQLFQDSRWAAALFDLEPQASLVPLLQPRDVDARIEKLLQTQGALHMLPTPWSETVSRAVIAAQNFPAAQFVATRISRTTFAALEESLPLLIDPPSVQRQVDAARETLRIRRTLHEEIHP
jgi:hypothetical protein